MTIHQERASVEIDSEGTVVVVRSLRAARGTVVLGAVVEEDVTTGLQAEIRFVDRIYSILDPDRNVTSVAIVAALLGAEYSGWRTKAEHEANPNSMTMNIPGGSRIVEPMVPPVRRRDTLSSDSGGIALDLMVLLRRGARGR